MNKRTWSSGAIGSGFWIYLIVGGAALAFAAWLTYWSPPAKAIRQGRPQSFGDKKQQQQRLPRKRPPKPRFTGRSASLNTWIKRPDKDIYYVDLRPVATVRRGEYIWNETFSSFFHPVGISTYNGVPFYVHEDGSIIVLPSDQDVSLQKKNSFIMIRLPEAPVGATECWVLGLVAGWGGEISSAHGESAVISFSYDGVDEKDSFKIHSCDIWEYTHQKRSVEKDNLIATKIEGVHLDMRGFQLRADSILKSITIQDTNPVSAPIFVAITLQRPAQSDPGPPGMPDSSGVVR